MPVEFIEKLLAIPDIDLDVQSDRFHETAVMLCLGMQSVYEHASDRKDKPRSYFQYAVEPDHEWFELLLEHRADLNKQDRVRCFALRSDVSRPSMATYGAFGIHGLFF